MNVRAALFLLLLAVVYPGFITGCSVINVHAKIDPAGGALTDSFGCVYDFDHGGIWYLVFIHEDGLLSAVHRHNPGIHLFLDNDADIIFQCRCSGRGEVIDVMRQTFRLSNGTVFLCDVESGNARIRQLPLPAPKCDGHDPEAKAKTIYALSLKPEIAGFLSNEMIARLGAEWKITAKRKQNPESQTGSK